MSFMRIAVLPAYPCAAQLRSTEQCVVSYVFSRSEGEGGIFVLCLKKLRLQEVHNTLKILVAISYKTEFKLILSDSQSMMPETSGLTGVINSKEKSI